SPVWCSRARLPLVSAPPTWSATRFCTRADSLNRKLGGMSLALVFLGKRRKAMSLVRLLGFSTLACGCVVGKYREVATSREVAYVEEKGKSCGSHSHRRNHPITTGRRVAVAPMTMVSKA